MIVARLVPVLGVALACCGSAPASGSMLPTGHADGVRVVIVRHRATFTFTKASELNLYSLIRGHRVTLTCVKLDPPTLYFLGTADDSWRTVMAPRRRGSMTLRLGGNRPDICSVADRRSGSEDASVPVTRAGAVYLDRRRTFWRLSDIAMSAADLAVQDHHRGTWPTADELAGFGDEYVPLDAPSDSPPRGKIGLFTDGQTHFEAVAFTRRGERLFYDKNGDVVSANFSESVCTSIPCWLV